MRSSRPFASTAFWFQFAASAAPTAARGGFVGERLGNAGIFCIFSLGLRQGADQHPHFRRSRKRQNDDTQRDVAVHSGRRALLTIEDAAELQLQQRHVVRMEIRPANVEAEGGIRHRELVRNAMRMRPDRIIRGECRGSEAFDMLQAMNTGSRGVDDHDSRQ